jgi:hypothetical protein
VPFLIIKIIMQESYPQSLQLFIQQINYEDASGNDLSHSSRTQLLFCGEISLSEGNFKGFSSQVRSIVLHYSISFWSRRSRPPCTWRQRSTIRAW